MTFLLGASWAMSVPDDMLSKLLAHATGAANDYQKDKQFRKLNAQKDTIDIKCIRGGHLTLVCNHDLVVGDVMMLDAGDKIVADCIVFYSQGLIIDEASLTGESDPIKKNKDTDPWIRSGTQVSAAMQLVHAMLHLQGQRWGQVGMHSDALGKEMHFRWRTGAATGGHPLPRLVLHPLCTGVGGQWQGAHHRSRTQLRMGQDHGAA